MIFLEKKNGRKLSVNLDQEFKKGLPDIIGSIWTVMSVFYTRHKVTTQKNSDLFWDLDDSWIKKTKKELQEKFYPADLNLTLWEIQ